MESAGDVVAEHWTGAVSLILAEYQAGHWTEDECRREILKAVEPPCPSCGGRKYVRWCPSGWNSALSVTLPCPDCGGG